MSGLEEIVKVELAAELIYSEAEVEAGIAKVAGEINAKLAGSHPVVLTVLNGGIIFAGKLLTQLKFPLEMEAINASRYRGQTRGSGIQWLVKPTLPLHGRTVLLLDDVLDEGITLAEVVNFCRQEGAAAVYVAVLLDKDLGRDKPCQADFVGLRADNRYLFGYGLDYKNHLRNAAGIFACTHF